MTDTAGRLRARRVAAVVTLGVVLAGAAPAVAVVRTGTPRADRLKAPSSSRHDTLRGLGGNDRLDTRDGRRGDVADCGAGRDSAQADAGDRTRFCENVTITRTGTSRPDRLRGTTGKDVLRGLGGADRLDTRDRKGGDVADCGAGRDRALIDTGDRTRGCEEISVTIARTAQGALAQRIGSVLGGAGPGSEDAVRYGLGVPNTGSQGDDEWRHYVDLFGQDQTYVCSPAGCAEDPQARLLLDGFNAQARARAGGSGLGGFGAAGECFGFVSTAMLFRGGQPDPAWSADQVLGRDALLQAGGLSVLQPDVYNEVISGPALLGQSREQYQRLRDTVRERHLLQTSWTFESWWEQWVRDARGITGARLYAILSQAVSQGQWAELGFYWPAPGGGEQGHAIAVRSLVGGPGSFRALLYDPNYPRSSGSVFVVRNDRWWLESDPAGLYPKEGGAVRLARADGSPTVLVLSEAQMTLSRPVAWWRGDLRTSPHPFLGARSAAEAGRRDAPGRVYAVVQRGRLVGVADAQGRQGLTVTGRVNGDPATSIPGVTVRVGAEAPAALSLPRGGPYTVRLAPQGGDAVVRLLLWDRRGLAVARAVAPGPGGTSEVTITGTAAGIAVRPPDGGAARVMVSRRSGPGRLRVAQAEQTRAAGALGVAITGNGKAIVAGGRGTGARDLRLSALGADGRAVTLRSAFAPAGDGERLELRPAWARLAPGDLVARRVGPAGSFEVVVPLAREAFAPLGRIRLTRHGRTLRWSAPLSRPARVTATLRLRGPGGGPAIRRILSGATGSTTLPRRLAPGRWRVTGLVLAQSTENPMLMQTRRVDAVYTLR